MRTRLKILELAVEQIPIEQSASRPTENEVAEGKKEGTSGLLVPVFL